MLSTPQFESLRRAAADLANAPRVGLSAGPIKAVSLGCSVETMGLDVEFYDAFGAGELLSRAGVDAGAVKVWQEQPLAEMPRYYLRAEAVAPSINA